MVDSKIIFGQPDRVYAMIDHGFSHVTNPKTFSAEAAGEVYILRSS
jgi:hypothetical protein